ncbi:MAG: 16S rRNA (cytosine(967)-C(5))-methyltransferase RsmB [Phycisphaerae bacterium]
MPKSARHVAIIVLNKFNPKRNYASQILNKLLDETNEKQRATDLVYGTIRNRNVIDTVIATFSGRPVERIPAKLLNIIRIGAFELIYSPETPEYSIVNEAVENTKAVSGRKQTSFVNAVLRQITRHISNRRIQLSQANLKATLPQTPFTGCEFDTCFLPDSTEQPVDYLSTCFSLPNWLVTDWLSEFGADSTQQICFASNRRPSIYLRPNTLKATTQELVERFRQADIECEIVLDADMIRIKSPRAVIELPSFAEGLFTVQDITASQAVRLLQPQPGWTILDLCAAPGTKTTQLAEMTDDKAEILATDFDAKRLEKIKENVTRLGIKNITVLSYQQIIDRKLTPDRFDCVLLDVPCSNTGVLERRIEVRYRIKQKAIKQLVDLQSQLLSVAAKSIKPKGKICYSTCSIQRCENSELIKDFLQKNQSFELESEQIILPSADPGRDHDGGYVAVLTRK